MFQLSWNQIGTSAWEIKRQNWTVVIICSRRPHNCKTCHFTLWKERERLRNVKKWKMHVQSVQNCCFSSSNMHIYDVLVAVVVVVTVNWKLGAFYFTGIFGNSSGENLNGRFIRVECFQKKKVCLSSFFCFSRFYHCAVPFGGKFSPVFPVKCKVLQL